MGYKPAMRSFRVEEWSWDRFAKACERCETVVGRYGVAADEQGVRHIAFWPHREWDGVAGPYRCTEHSTVAHPRP